MLENAANKKLAPCPECRKRNLPDCMCGGGGAGGGSDKADDDEEKSKTPAPELTLSYGLDLWKNVSLCPAYNSAGVNIKASGDAQFNNFTLVFQFGGNLSPEARAAVQTYLNEVLAEFEEFKEELEAKEGAPMKGFSAAMHDNQLVIQIHNPNGKVYFEQFIERLNEKGLLPIPTSSRNDADTPNQKASHSSFNPTPFDMVPRPRGEIESK